MTTHSLIVVGVDGSPSSVDALRWAAKQASLTGSRIEAVLSWQYPTQMEEIFDAESPAWTEKTKRRLDEILAEAGIGDEQDCTRTVINGHPVAVLVNRSAKADLLVVGSRGRGGFSGLLLGSVSSSVASHASCPVVVVRHHEPDPSQSDASPTD